ncbi:MAG: ATP-binding protein [Planctomycetota bacterium]
MGISLGPQARRVAVLHVDRDERSASLVRAALEEAGAGDFAVEHVREYDEAVGRLLLEEHDLALVADDLGSREGLELLEELTASGCAVPLLLLSTRDPSPELDERAYAAGAAGVLGPRDLAQPRALERSLRFLERGQRSERRRAAEHLALLSGYLEREGRNATSGIMGAVDVVASCLRSGARSEEVCARIDERLRALLSTFHTVAFLSGVPEPARRRLGLRELLRDLAAATASAHPRLEVAVTGPEVTLRADAQLLRILFAALLQNSREAMDGAGRIQVSVIFDGAQVRARVEDEGRLPPGPVGRILQPFFTTKPTALGLGLTVARRVAEAHGGALTPTRTARGGLLVEVALPVGEAARQTGPTSLLVG